MNTLYLFSLFVLGDRAVALVRVFKLRSAKAGSKTGGSPKAA